MCGKPSVERLAREIDWLEAVIDTYGAIVPKQPDVWGEARLTRHRHQIEQELAKDLDRFRETLNASLRRSDQSFLGLAFTLSAAMGQGTTEQAQTQLTNVIDMVQEPAGAIRRTQIGDLPSPTFYSALEGKQIGGLSLEPTIVIQQKYRYLQLLNELRRLNEGDDTADSPGYSLNIVRIPVSILPGKKTRRGYGAEITITARSQLTPELLPTTFRSLVINDIVDFLALPGQKVLDHPDLVQPLQNSLKQQMNTLATQARVSSAAMKQLEETQMADEQELVERIQKRGILEFAGTLVSGRSTQPLLPFPPAHLIDIFGLGSVFAPIVIDGVTALEKHPVNQSYPHLPDVEAFLRGELHAAYDFLTRPEAWILWQKYCTPELVDAIRARRRWVSDELFRQLGSRLDQQDRFAPPIYRLRRDFFRDVLEISPRAAYSTTSSLAWAIIVDAALLNNRLIEDMRVVATEKGCPCLGALPPWPDFYSPNPSPQARETFNEYVRCRWPIKVFALDPVLDEQNVADVFSMRREMQLAAAAALASGNISAGAAFRFIRRLELDLETISLNPKIVGFAHGEDTFGWRFMPRIQTPPTVNNAQAFYQTLTGGPDRDWMLNQRELEPGMRELTAVVLMPCFVPHLVFETRANWFCLTNPKHRELTLHDAMHISRTWQTVRTVCPHVCNTAAYRGADLAVLYDAVEQIERKLPLQSMQVPIPYDNTLGGFEMFNSGITDLAPSLTGWYGAPGVTLGDQGVACVCSDSDKQECFKAGGMPIKGVNLEGEQCAGTCIGTTLFLVGKNLSVHDTTVIAGGRCAPMLLLSREIMRVTIPPNVNYLNDEKGRHVVDVHLATPYGISNHLLIRAVRPGAPEAKPSQPVEGAGFYWKQPSYRASLSPILSAHPPYYLFQFTGKSPGGCG
jgi:hypothetical protein